MMKRDKDGVTVTCDICHEEIFHAEDSEEAKCCMKVYKVKSIRRSDEARIKDGRAYMHVCKECAKTAYYYE